MKKLKKVFLLLLTVSFIFTIALATKANATTEGYDDLSNFLSKNNTTSNTVANNTTGNTAANNTTSNTVANNTTSNTVANNTTGNTAANNTTSNTVANTVTNNIFANNTTKNATRNTATNKNHLGNEGIGDTIFGSKTLIVVLIISTIVAIFTYKKIKDYSNI